MSQETDRVFQRQLQKLALEEQAATSDYNAHLYNGDDDAAGDAMMQVANARAQRETLVQQYQQELQRMQPHRPYVSEESRQARSPAEMDSQDLANLMNTSRYSGKGFTADDYNRLRTGLGGYKAARGLESK
jgi:hypothetical protein